MKKRSLLLAIGLLVSVCATAQESTPSELGTSMANFLKIGVGARSAGMGDAYVALSNDVSCLYWNPGGLANLEANEVMVNTTNWLVDTRLYFLATSINLGSLGTVGLSLNTFSSGDILETTVEQPSGTGRFFTASDLSAGISYSRKVSETFSAGVTFKFIHESLDRSSASTFAVDVGSVFVTDFLNNLRIGFAFSNLGGRMQLDGTDLSIQYLAEPGFKYARAQLGTEPWDIPLLFRFGIATDAVRSEQVRLTVAADFVDVRDHSYQVNTGAECTVLDVVSLRGGYRFNYDESNLTFGVGLKLPEGSFMGARIDYAYMKFNIFNNVHRFSLLLTY